MSDKKQHVQTVAQGCGPFYFMGMVGSLVYFLQNAEGFWMIVLAFLKPLVWPAFIVYDLFKFLD